MAEVGDKEKEELGITGKVVSRSELKARRAMAKLGLKSIPDINRVVIRKSDNSLFVIEQPDVYKNSTGETHIVFGNSRIESPEEQQAKATQFLGTQEPAAEPLVEEEVEELEDSNGLEESDIEIVMSQASVSRGKAIRALRANDNDIVNSIMELNIES